MKCIVTWLLLSTALFVCLGCDEDTGLSPGGGGSSRLFIFPFGVGSSWEYDYSYWENYPKISGTYTWEVTAANASSILFLVHRDEYVLDNPYQPPVHVETTTSIALDRNAVSMTLPITEEGLPETHAVPRSLPGTSDTVVVSWKGLGPSYENATYLSGVGLIAYVGRGGTGNNPRVHTLTLKRYDLK